MDASQRSFPPLLALAAAALALAALLWRVSVEPVDFGYVRYVGIADEMVRSGDWIVLRLVDVLYLRKPPLFVWLVALPLWLAGNAPDWVGHAPNLLALVIALVCVQRLATAVYGRGEPVLASLFVFAATWETFNQATGKRLDPLFAAFLTAAYTAFFLGSGGTRKGRARPWLLALSWLFVALATLTKGPVAILFFLVVALPWAAWTGRVRAFGSAGSLAGIALLGALSALWPALLVENLGFSEALRALSETSFTTRTGDLLLYLRSLPVQALPWSIFFPALAVWLWRRRPDRDNDGIRFLGVWFLAIFVMLHFPEARHQRYLQPATPALALLLVSLWYEPGGGYASPSGLAAALRRIGMGLWLVLLALAGFGAAVGLLFLDREPIKGRVIPAEGLLVAPLALAIGVGAVLALLSLRRGGVALRSPLPLASLVLGVFASFSVVAGGDLRAHDRTARAREVLAPVTAGRPAALFGVREQQIQITRLFSQQAVPLLPDAPAVAAWVQTAAPDGGGLVITDAAGRHAIEGIEGVEVRGLAALELAGKSLELVELRPRSFSTP